MKVRKGKSFFARLPVLYIMILLFAGDLVFALYAGVGPDIVPLPDWRAPSVTALSQKEALFDLFALSDLIADGYAGFAIHQANGLDWRQHFKKAKK
jgi:hypothetical protein